jgi:hypothetical protein
MERARGLYMGREVCHSCPMNRTHLKIGALVAAVLLYLLVGRAESTTQRPTQAQIDRTPELEHSLPRGILDRHRRYERAQRRCYDRPWNKGRAQVCGPHQILVWDKTTRDGKRLARMVKGRGGSAWGIAVLLDDSRADFARICGARRDAECVCPWQFLNNGDRTRLCAKLAPKGDS